MVLNQAPCISPMCPVGLIRGPDLTVTTSAQLLAVSGFRCSAKNFSIAV
jgi:hypothetical protein